MNGANGLDELLAELAKELKLTEGQQITLSWRLSSYFTRSVQPQLSDVEQKISDTAYEILNQLLSGR